MPMSGTVNTTSFARDTLSATTLILDALATVGNERRTLLTQAQELLFTAHADAYGPDELALAQAILAVTRKYEATGADR